ncbi:hypothetical protein N7468_008490 [Penicillium chermesinum]|uniref:Apple domain-containing protein n=1 Tax=Penicillium chermesinum TaxID=63820 RepID=A0A9W9NQC0_9EURO|nr:uncharacterized protein N7468_008490 [Penicillium chermesinum]KAJ5223948.1 hypothetical protein N7468_008490 [Penicillium chermesinum]
MSSVRTGLVISSLAWLAKANTPVVHTEVSCTTQVTTSYLPGPSFVPANPPVPGSGGQYWCPAFAGDDLAGGGDSTKTPCTEELQSPVDFTLYWNDLMNPKSGADGKAKPPQPVDLLTDYEFETFLILHDEHDVGISVTFLDDKPDNGVPGVLTTTDPKGYRVPAGEHTIRLEWKNPSEKQALAESLESVQGQFQFDKVVACSSGGSNGKKPDDNGQNGGSKPEPKDPNSVNKGLLGKPILRGKKFNDPAECAEACAQSKDQGCKWASWIRADQTCWTYKSDVRGPPFTELKGNDLIILS